MPQKTFKCKHCGKRETVARWITGEELLYKKVCQECDFWLTLACDAADFPHTVAVTMGEAYFIGKEDSKFFRGYGGAAWVIQFNDGVTVRTTNLWHKGTVSPECRAELPDNCSVEQA